jgi:N-acetylglucosamine-6-phosphate deacetylase
LDRKLLRNCVLLDPEGREPEPGALLLEEGRIAARLAPGAPAPAGAQSVDLRGGRLAPGFLDLHFHGRTIFAQPDACAAALREDARALLRHGTTGFLATTVAEAAGALAARVGALAQAAGGADSSGARVLGIHLEGPWINPQAAGAQPAPGIRAPDAAELSELLARAEGWLRMVTLAPELPGAAQLQRTLARRGALVALGHSLASAQQVEGALGEGARHVTHLFNAMGPFHQREPGLAGCALADDRLSCDLICDGVHVHPLWVKLAARAKRERLVLVTDRIDPPAGAAGFGAGELHDDGAALRLADGRLAGSRVTLERALGNAVAFGALSELEAVAACTLRPARLLGLEGECGTLRPGARADLAVLDAEGRVTETWLGGRRVLELRSAAHAG